MSIHKASGLSPEGANGERPFKGALSSDDALAVMRTEVERGWWDPEIFEVFTTMVQRPVGSPSSSDRSPRYSGTPG